MPLLLSDDVDDDEDCKIGSVAPFSSESSDLAFYLKERTIRSRRNPFAN